MLFRNILIGLTVFSGFATITLIGKKREPITSFSAAITVLIQGIVIYGLLNWT